MQYNFFNQNETSSIRTNKWGSFTDIEAFASNHKKVPVTMEQVHKSNFTFISEVPSKTIPHVDGVLTNNPELLLTVKTADCLPILLYHPSGVVGALHAGRKSTEQQLLAKVLTYLKEEKNIHSDISLWFGPAICESCYQIDRDNNTHYNLISENMRQAYAVSPAENLKIIVNGDCTQCLCDEYHSYRVEKNAVKMNYFGISLLD
ncbi:MAG: polyphenol oxidase family protein [Candidatus Pacebacteria bacterium]|nr:polyphenol oxidase family protein [Candidatus Paceibacterota bacterium]PIR63704.1 MAG: hypothetical protein COU64_03140 [Candidatus Pacebacteria bacterium CG10_big_fil_rev_8_21_14_0_10_40_26]PIZ79707.1 MAG: hypothetical protein COY01_00180 [Candidatus Pacebacteria bacterium CG_4_10_14_0_2_um_filter_40_20]PJA68351.1 MAG: hypothetical protein CO156_05135 [Candidatus Pacebacteria bacterium CG_4_9_14_3_um_filter_40_12]PJC41213.1 MAG: hypothetical protein CO041_05205 [Candidatus Pacebacteria bact